MRVVSAYQRRFLGWGTEPCLNTGVPIWIAAASAIFRKLRMNLGNRVSSPRNSGSARYGRDRYTDGGSESMGGSSQSRRVGSRLGGRARVMELDCRGESVGEPGGSGYASAVGRIGGLAVALGIGAAVVVMPAVALADTRGSGGATGSEDNGGSSAPTAVPHGRLGSIV